MNIFHNISYFYGRDVEVLKEVEAWRVCSGTVHQLCLQRFQIFLNQLTLQRNNVTVSMCITALILQPVSTALLSAWHYSHAVLSGLVSGWYLLLSIPHHLHWGFTQVTVIPKGDVTMLLTADWSVRIVLHHHCARWNVLNQNFYIFIFIYLTSLIICVYVCVFSHVCLCTQEVTLWQVEVATISF